jgi:hypothetical protein
MFVAAESWLPKCRLQCEKEKTAEKCQWSLTLTFVPYRPYASITSARRQIVAGQRVTFSLDRSVIEQLFYLVVQILGDL